MKLKSLQISFLSHLASFNIVTFLLKMTLKALIPKIYKT